MEFFLKIAERWLAFYGLHAAESSLFMLTIFALATSVRRDVRLCYSLYVVALLKLFLPPFFSASAPIPAIAVAPRILQAVTAGSAQQSTPSISISAVLFALWCLLAIALLGVILLQNLRLRRRLRNAVPMKIHGSSELFRQLPFELDVLTSSEVHTPLLLGTFRPRLYLPENCTLLSERELQSIVAHELGHYSSRDMWVLPLQTLALVLFWWNPLTWILHRKLLHYRELRCDEIAIAHSNIAPVEYSKLLYRFLEQQHVAGTPIPAGAYFAQDKQNIFHRMQHILELGEKKHKASRLVQIVVLALAMAAIVPLSVAWHANPLKSVQSASVEKPLFVPYDSAPEPIGGFAALQKQVVYPEIARNAGIEGRVIINVLVKSDGTVAETTILKSLGDSGCDEAASAAVKAVKWQPALNGNQPVTVWVGIPIIFKLPES